MENGKETQTIEDREYMLKGASVSIYLAIAAILVWGLAIFWHPFGEPELFWHGANFALVIYYFLGNYILSGKITQKYSWEIFIICPAIIAIGLFTALVLIPTL